MVQSPASGTPVAGLYEPPSSVDEFSPVHVWMAPAWQEKMQRAAQKSPAVMYPACSRSPDGLLALMESANRGAASGHAAAPPSRAMNSRRLMPNIGLPPPRHIPPGVSTRRARAVGSPTAGAGSRTLLVKWR